MEENKVLEEAKELIPEIVTDITIEDSTTGDHPIVKGLVIGAVALGGAVGGYLFKRHRDRRWLKDFESEENDTEPDDIEELDDDDSSEQEEKK